MKALFAIFGMVALVAVVFVFWGYVIQCLSGDSKEERIALERMRLDREEDERQGRGR